MRVFCSAAEPIRGEMTWDERWAGPDHGLILCWENGRRLRIKGEAQATSAARGELPQLDWKGGVARDVKAPRKVGTLQYLATWQGLRGEDLDVDPDGERTITCTATGHAVSFRARGWETEE